MAIQHRRGADVDFKAEKMLPGEIAVTTDGTRKVYAAFAPGDVKELASKEEVQKIVDNFEISVDEKINEAVQQVTDEATVQVEGIVAKGEEILNSIPADYQETVKEVAQLTEGLVSTNQSKADAIICEAEGSVIVVTDSSDTEFEELKLFGRSEQVTTTGAQLLDYETWKATTSVEKGTAVFENNGVTITATENDCFTTYYPDGFQARIEVSEGDTITISWETNTDGLGHVHIFQEGSSINGVLIDIRTDNKLSYTVPANVTFITFRFGVYIAGTTISYKNIMINKGSTALPYEPYTGGQASPNPEYPQEIKTAVASDVKVCGKNLLKNTATSQTINGVTFTVNEDGSVTKSGTASHDTLLKINEGTLSAGRYILSGGISGACRFYIKIGSSTWHTSVGLDITFDLAEESAFDTQIQIKPNDATTCTFYPMIRLATIEDDAYEPYTENSITLSQPIELNGIGDVTDSIVEKDGVFGVERKFAEVVLDGSEDERWDQLYAETSNKLRFRSSLGSAITSDTDASGIHSLNSHFPLSVVGGTYICENCYTIGSDSKIIISKDTVTTTTEFIEWLAENPITVLYELAEPTFEPLPEADQIALRSLHTYYPITHITNDADAHMEVKYVADTKNHIKQNYIPLSKYTALEERVAAIEELVIS